MKHPIASTLIAWYSEHGRQLPWRQTRDAYCIWLSEVILQQTRVEQGLAYYLRFTERFPRIELLAAASEDEVLKLWQGLGYYSRARNLHAAARQVVAEFGGKFPADHDAIRSLRGVGDYTAAAIASLAYDLPHAVVDGNVYRVLSRLFDLDIPIDTTEGKRTYATLAQELLDKQHAATYNQAIMDFGATCCTPQNPHCDSCPLRDICQALTVGTVAVRPVKQGRTKIRDRYFHYLHLQANGQTLLHRREGGDIWQGLYEFPLIETSEVTDFATLIQSDPFRTWLGEQSFTLRETRPMALHQLSHQRLHTTFYRIEVEQLPAIDGTTCIREEELDDYAVARLTEKYLER
ncbi:MAG: A/G-specific adenine glycosylase [Alistipes sp.]|nr:A/G-specific adenine glycosylase [Alistipes sp.]